jgi:serine/threonine-protein kinase HipA
MKLAMAVGHNRHYVVKTVVPRHFIESAVKGGMGRKAAIGVVEELYQNAPAALDRTLAELPRGFPDKIAEAVTAGVRQRIEQLPSVHEAAASSST